MNDEILRRSEALLERCRSAALMVATVESCTGGLLASALTSIAGSSDVVERGLVTYTNEAKTELASVPADLIEAHGAVSEEVARAMAEGGLVNSRADIAVGITGVAGPGGGSEAKPVGCVHIAAARRGRTTLHRRHLFPGDRTKVREASVLAAIASIGRLVGRSVPDSTSQDNHSRARGAARRRVIGVDFSGAKRAGDHIWIAVGTQSRGRLTLDSCRPARELAGGARDRDPALAALVAFLASERRAAAGLDFPFSLPESLIDETGWEDFLRAFPGRYPDADSLRAVCRRAAGGRELKRRTDVAAKVPFSAYNLRLYRQTHAGIASVLLPLVERGAATVMPMQAPAPGKLLLAETCPASVLKRLELYTPYKGRGDGLRDARLTLLDELIDKGLLNEPNKSLGERMIEDTGGDALDAAIAAIAAANLPRPRGAARDPVERIEGRVYF